MENFDSRCFRGMPARCPRSLLGLCVASIVGLAGPAAAAPGVQGNGRISFGQFFSQTDNQAHNAHSYIIGISDDGNFVSYQSQATNITDEDPNPRHDCYRYDRLFGLTLLVSKPFSSPPPNAASRRPAQASSIANAQAIPSSDGESKHS